MILQLLFDAVLLFGILFLFHYSVNQTQKKKEEGDILKNLQVQEIKENLQELLMTLKQLGKEVSENIQEQVQEAEAKTEDFKKVVSKLQRDLNKVTKLAEEVDAEKRHLEEKIVAVEIAKKKSSLVNPGNPDSSLGSNGLSPSPNTKFPQGLGLGSSKRTKGFSSGVVREVYRLSDENIEMSEIVQKTKLSRAEIQLILNLRGNGFSTPN